MGGDGWGEKLEKGGGDGGGKGSGGGGREQKKREDLTKRRDLSPPSSSESSFARDCLVSLKEEMLGGSVLFKALLFLLIQFLFSKCSFQGLIVPFDTVSLFEAWNSRKRNNKKLYVPGSIPTESRECNVLFGSEATARHGRLTGIFAT